MTRHKSQGGAFHFPPPVTIPPTSAHENTIIFLHGRGQTAEHFYPQLLSTQLPNLDITLRDAFPNVKFVFPNAPLMRATKYRRSLIRQWYDGSGDWEPEALGNMSDSITYVHSLINEEAGLLGGDASRIALGGFSQGCAMALTCSILWEGGSLGAVVALSGFIPLNAHMTDLLGGGDVHDDEQGESDGFVFGTDCDDEMEEKDAEPSSPLKKVVQALADEAEISSNSANSSFSFLNTRVFIGHGTEDPEVEYKHSCLSVNLLNKMGVDADLHTYKGLGHAYSPEELADVVVFLRATLSGT